MAKTKLCSRDEWELQEALETFRDKLQEIGISGNADVTIFSDGNTDASFCIDDATTLKLRVDDDGDKVTKEYCYV